MAETVTLIDPKTGKRVNVAADRVRFAEGIGFKRAPTSGSVAGSGQRPQRPGPTGGGGRGGLPQRGPDKLPPSLPNSTRLFKQPSGLWVTVGNMAAALKDYRSFGYTGPWFPSVSEGLHAFIRSSDYLEVYNALTKFNSEAPGAGQGEEVFDLEAFLAGIADSLAGGGRGAGGPIYQAPDGDAVRESLEGYQVAVSGQVDEDLLTQAVDEFLTVHRQDFDDKGAQHDPFVAAKSIIRSSDAYKDIHKLRPKGVNELAWVTQQQGRLRTLGLDDAQSEQLGIKLARVGASQQAAASAGQKAFFQSTGRVQQDQRNSLKASARAVMGLL